MERNNLCVEVVTGEDVDNLWDRAQFWAVQASIASEFWN